MHESLPHKGTALTGFPRFLPQRDVIFSFSVCLKHTKREGIRNEPDSHRQLYCKKATATESHAGAVIRCRNSGRCLDYRETGTSCTFIRKKSLCRDPSGHRQRLLVYFQTSEQGAKSAHISDLTPKSCGGMIVFLTFTLRSARPAVFTPSQDSVSAFFPAPQLAKVLLPVGNEGCISFSSHAQLVQSIGQLVLAR